MFTFDRVRFCTELSFPSCLGNGFQEFGLKRDDIDNLSRTFPFHIPGPIRVPFQKELFHNFDFHRVAGRLCTIALRSRELTQVTQADVHFGGRKKFLKSDHPLAYFGGDEVTVPSIRSFRVTLGRPRPRRLFRLGSFVFDRVFTFDAGTVGTKGRLGFLLPRTKLSIRRNVLPHALNDGLRFVCRRSSVLPSAGWGLRF